MKKYLVHRNGYGKKTEYIYIVSENQYTILIRKYYLLDSSPFFNTIDPRPLLKVQKQEFTKLRLNTSTSLLISPYDRSSVQNDKVSKEDMSLCENEGVCDELSKACHCNNYWEGDFCHVDVDECSKNEFVCQNDGICINEPGSFKCNCEDTGYTGTRCEVDVNECETVKPCLNGGKCSNLIGNFTCNCTGTGFTGAICGVDTCTQALGVYF